MASGLYERNNMRAEKKLFIYYEQGVPFEKDTPCLLLGYKKVTYASVAGASSAGASFSASAAASSAFFFLNSLNSSYVRFG